MAKETVTEDSLVASLGPTGLDSGLAHLIQNTLKLPAVVCVI